MKKLELTPFKIVVLILMIWASYSIHNISKNGRYQSRQDQFGIVDTRSGKVYYYGKNENHIASPKVLTKEIE